MSLLTNNQLYLLGGIVNLLTSTTKMNGPTLLFIIKVLYFTNYQSHCIKLGKNFHKTPSFLKHLQG